MTDDPLRTTLLDLLYELRDRGLRSNGDHHASNIHVPQPFTFMLLKLHAFHDRKDDASKRLGRHHALDLYRIVAMMREEEHRLTLSMLDRHRESQAVATARRIVAESFRDDRSAGIIVRLKEHELFDKTMDVPAFMSALREFFAA